MLSPRAPQPTQPLSAYTSWGLPVGAPSGLKKKSEVATVNDHASIPLEHLHACPILIVSYRACAVGCRMLHVMGSSLPQVQYTGSINALHA